MHEVRMNIAKAGAETGALLTEYLEKLDISANRHAPIVICYGQPTSAPTSLNANCGTDKIQRMKMMNKVGVQTVPWFTAKNIPIGTRFPVLARKINGYGGTDIVPVFQHQEVAWRAAAGWDWFSSYIPVKAEYRVWVFRRLILDTYEKVMQRPADYKYIGRNFRNGFEFKLSNEESIMVRKSAMAAVSAIDLDFGAVDLLLGEDNNVYVLEVNTAPGVIRSGAHNTLKKLASCIAQWVKEGCPEQL